MFKKFNWGLTRPFLYSWPILGFSSLRTDYGLVVQVNSLVVKVLERLFFKKYKKFNKVISLSHIILKHFNSPFYLVKPFLLNKKIKRFTKLVKKYKFKKKRKTLKKKAKKKLKRKALFLKNKTYKTSIILVEIFYNFFDKKRRYKPEKIKKFKKLKFLINKNKKKKAKKKIKFLRKQRKRLGKAAIAFFYNFNRSMRYRGLVRYYLDGFKEKDPNYSNIVRSPYLFKMAKIAFSYYSKKVQKVKRVSFLGIKYLKVLRHKIKQLKFKKRFKRRRFKSFIIKRKLFKKRFKYKKLRKTLKLTYKSIKRLYFLVNTFKKLKWKLFSLRLQHAFTQFNISVLPVFRRIRYLSGSASFYANYLIKNLKTSRKPLVFKAIKPLLRNLKKSTSILGLKILIKGRFTRNQRATQSRVGYGFVPYGSIAERVDYSCKTFNARFGTTSIKLFIRYAK